MIKCSFCFENVISIWVFLVHCEKVLNRTICVKFYYRWDCLKVCVNLQTGVSIEKIPVWRFNYGKKKAESPQKTAMSQMMHDYLKKNDVSIKKGADVCSVMRDMMSVLLEGVLNEELDEELVTQSTITTTKKWKTAATVISVNLCIPAIVTWKWQSQETETVNTNCSSSKNIRTP